MHLNTHSIADSAHNITEAKEDNNQGGSSYYGPIKWCPGRQPRIYGYIYEDKNGNGRRDGNERLLKNSVVKLWQNYHLVKVAYPGWPIGYYNMNLGLGGNFALTAVLPNSTYHWTTRHTYYVNVPSGARGPYYFGAAKAAKPHCVPAGNYVVKAPPSLSLGPQQFAYPLIKGQGGIGFRFAIHATGGWAEQRHKVPEFHGGKWVCVEHTLHHYNDPVSRVTSTVSLQKHSRNWINHTLAQFYPGISVKGHYPDGSVIYHGRTMGWHGVYTYPAPDPGSYDGTITVETAGTPVSSSQQVQKSFSNVKVYFLESRLIR